MHLNSNRNLLVLLLSCTLLFAPSSTSAADLSSADVLKSIDRAKSFLASQQQKDGSWNRSGGTGSHEIGIASLAVLAMINAGMPTNNPHVQAGLKYLRSIKEPAPGMTYEVSLMTMALAAAKDPARDRIRMQTLIAKLESGQIKTGKNAGSWSYGISKGTLDKIGDRSNSQYAILALRDAAHAGVHVNRRTWELARRHWMDSQSSDGGWGYSGRGNSQTTGSMTVAGIATLVITSSMLQDDKDVLADGTPKCCTKREDDQALQRGINWMARHFAVGSNPGGKGWVLYYLYGLERAGRLSGRRFFGDHDWYREGAEYLIARQSKGFGGWGGSGLESNPIVGTSFALLFLSKGLSPVLMNKLKFGPRDPKRPNVLLGGDQWNLHSNDVRNLTDLISGMPKWPKLMTWQVIDIDKVVRNGDVTDLLQSPILYLSGQESLILSEQEIALLKEYINQGGFLFAVNCCNGAGFHDDFHKLIQKLYPNGEARLKRLTPEHPIFRSEYELGDAAVELWGVDVGCRTAIVYSPDDLSCLWNKWSRQSRSNKVERFRQLNAMVSKATRVGVNVVAYATGREPPVKLDARTKAPKAGEQDRIERGLLQVAKLRHPGGWNAAPQALRNLLFALNQSVGLAASTKQRNLPATDPNIFKYPIVYMHGRNTFQLSEQERKQLVRYLNRGGVLFADSCCGTSKFDRSFRALMTQMFPKRRLEQIPAEHELFTSKIGYDIRSVKRRGLEANNPNAAFNTVVKTGKPYLEGVKIGDRYAVIYSKYDISCALERQASIACEGYVSEDAVKIAINVILYCMLQDVSYAKLLRDK